MYNDERIQSLICCARACIRLDTGGLRSHIQFKGGGWLLRLQTGSLIRNFPFKAFSQRYRKSGPLAFRGHSERCPGFSALQLHLSKRIFDETPIEGKPLCVDVFELGTRTPLLCCPEDHYCSEGCRDERTLCRICQILVCRDCQLAMMSEEILPRSLMNDNWLGYVDSWIYASDVTWMEKACASPFWAGLMLLCIDQQSRGRRKHLMHEKLYKHEGRIAWKGQLFSAPMDWSSMLQQMEDMDKKETQISLPIAGAVLAARVRIVITSGLMNVSSLLKQATVRRNVVVQLIRMFRDAGHPDYQNVDMRGVAERAKRLAPTDDATIPNEFADFCNYMHWKRYCFRRFLPSRQSPCSLMLVVVDKIGKRHCGSRRFFQKRCACCEDPERQRIKIGSAVLFHPP